MDAVDDPADLRFPVNGFEDATSCGGRDDVIADALDLHFRTGEAGEVAADVECDWHGGARVSFSGNI